MDRGRDRRYESDRTYGGQSYRPSERSEAPPRPSYRGYRSPPPRRRASPAYTERYAPNADRRRSCSPPFAGRDDISYRRPRTPPRRVFSPRRDERARSPPRSRRYSRSPVRARSPPLNRRERSPYDRRRRSPSPPPRRALSPRDRYERRPYSPLRGQRSRFREENNYRPRERTRSPLARRPEHLSRAHSPVSSRRSSPPMHPDRLAQSSSRPRSPPYRESKSMVTQRNDTFRESPPPRRSAYSPRPKSPRRETTSYRSPPHREPAEAAIPVSRPKYASPPPPPPQQSSSTSYRANESRGPPSQPSSGYDVRSREPPSGPASARSVPISAHNRLGSTSILTAPTRPRGGPSFHRGDSREHPYGGPPPHRGGRPPPPAPFHGPRQGYGAHSPLSERVPNGPRSGTGGPPSSTYDAPRQGPPFRTNNSSSTTYPRTQRFTNHLASIPSIVSGGKALPPVDPAAAKKLSQLEEDADRLRKQIDEKQKEKRAGLREWETRERESRREGLRSEFAEAQLEGFNGEVIGGQAF